MVKSRPRWLSRWRARRCAISGVLNARAVRLVTTTVATPSALVVPIFRGGGGCLVLPTRTPARYYYHAPVVLYVAAGNHEINVALRFAAAVFGRYRQHDAFARFDLLRGVGATHPDDRRRALPSPTVGAISTANFDQHFSTAVL